MRPPRARPSPLPERRVSSPARPPTRDARDEAPSSFQASKLHEPRPLPQRSHTNQAFVICASSAPSLGPAHWHRNTPFQQPALLTRHKRWPVSTVPPPRLSTHIDKCSFIPKSRHPHSQTCPSILHQARPPADLGPALSTGHLAITPHHKLPIDALEPAPLLRADAAARRCQRALHV